MWRDPILRENNECGVLVRNQKKERTENLSTSQLICAKEKNTKEWEKGVIFATTLNLSQRPEGECEF